MGTGADVLWCYFHVTVWMTWATQAQSLLFFACGVSFSIERRQEAYGEKCRRKGLKIWQGCVTLTGIQHFKAGRCNGKENVSCLNTVTQEMVTHVAPEHLSHSESMAICVPSQEYMSVWRGEKVFIYSTVCRFLTWKAKKEKLKVAVWRSVLGLTHPSVIISDLSSERF